jgi:hypothetical protein
VTTTNEKVAAVEEQPTAAVVEAEATGEETSAKEAIYELIAEFVKSKTDKRIGKSGGRIIFDLVVDNVFAAAAKDGTFRFNGGFGSLHVRQYGAGSRRLPSGQQTTFGEREKLRYEQGVVVTALIENEGNLEEAYKVRGSRVKEVSGDAAPAAKPAAKTAPAKPAVAKPAPAAAAPVAEPGEGGGTDGEIDLS